jgi:AraC-like DNA-binding protein/quercetin dioxygenase-like cupin family protein
MISNKPLLEKVTYPTGNAFKISHVKEKTFSAPWHFHPEYELVYILRGSGKRIVGHHVQSFVAGDLILLGGFLPHIWVENIGNSSDAEWIVLQFSDHIFPHKTGQINEFKSIHQLLALSNRGVKIEGGIRNNVKKSLFRLIKMKGFTRVLLFYELLHDLSKNKDNSLLLPDLDSIDYAYFKKGRMERIMGFLSENFRKPISLNEIAGIAHMNRAAFCRYFREKTNRTFFDFLAELRISHACKLLQKDQHSISEICIESGFMNKSNFNRRFKAITGCTPGLYKKKLLAGEI